MAPCRRGGRRVPRAGVLRGSSGRVSPCSAGGGQGVESAEAVEDQAGERRRSGQVQPGAPAGGREASGDREQPMAEALGFPAASRMVGEGEDLHPGDQIAGQGDDRAPDLVGPEGTAFKPSAAADTPGQTLAAATGWRTVTVGGPSPANAAGRGTARSGPRRSTACRLPGRRGHHRAHRTYGRGKGAVLRLLEVNGVARRRQSLTPEQVREAIRLYGLGWPLGRIGERFGRHHSVVLRALERAGVPRRDSHGTER
jgi:hypothetical protein